MTDTLTMDPTSAAVLAMTPLIPIPPIGKSPELERLRAARSGYGFAFGSDGLIAIYRRPWLSLDMKMPLLPFPISGGQFTIPYGPCWPENLHMRSGKIPLDFYHEIIDLFTCALPNEAGCFIAWHEVTHEWRLVEALTIHATPSSLQYETPALEAGWHIVLDAHSHGHGRPFFSATDDRDDCGSTKISMVIGRLDTHDRDNHDVVFRLCANGAFLPITQSPFE